jgi:hypothetical protein
VRANGLLATSILQSSSPKNGKNIGSRKISLPYSATPTTTKQTKKQTLNYLKQNSKAMDISARRYIDTKPKTIKH